MPEPAPALDDFHRLCADLLRAYGLTRPAGQCFSMIWRAAQAPSADDLVRLCGISRTGVSVALKELRDWGLVDVVTAVGERRALFLAPADAAEVLRRLIAERERRDLAPLLDRLAQLRDSEPRADALGHALAESLTELRHSWGSAEDEVGKKKKKKKKS